MLRTLLAAALSSAAAGSALAQQPAPDPLAALPGEISAVLDFAAAPRLLLIEAANGVSAPRLLAVGEEYREGWRLEAVTSATVTLGREGRSRTIELPANLRPPVQRAAPPVPIAPFSSAALRPSPTPSAADDGQVFNELAKQAALASIRQTLAQSPDATGKLERLSRFQDTSDGSGLVMIVGPGGRSVVVRNDPVAGIVQFLPLEGLAGVVDADEATLTAYLESGR